MLWTAASAQQPPPRPFNGLTTGVGDLHRLSNAKTRSISPENFTGEKGKGGMSTNGLALHRISNPNFGPQAYSQHNVSTSAPMAPPRC